MGTRAGELAAMAVALWLWRDRAAERMCVEQWVGRCRQMPPFSSLQQERVDKKGWGAPNTNPPVNESLEVHQTEI